MLAGKTVALIFGKPSTRTRVSFSVGVHQMGGMPLYLSEQELQMRKSESIEDTARVLSRFVDAIVIRTFAQKDVDDLAANASVPVINALTDDDHPCQALADILTFQEHFADYQGRKIVFLGDGNNVAASLAEAGAMAGIDVCLSVPEGYDLPAEKMASIQKLAEECGVRVWVERDPAVAVAGASALYTDVWISMGQTGRRRQGRGPQALPSQRGAAREGPARRHRAALPARPSWGGDHRRGHGRAAVEGVRPGGEQAACAEGTDGLPHRGAGEVNKRQRQHLIRRMLRNRTGGQPARVGGRAGGRRL